MFDSPVSDVGGFADLLERSSEGLESGAKPTPPCGASRPVPRKGGRGRISDIEARALSGHSRACMEADHATDPKTQQAADRQMWRQCIGYGFVGLGAPSLFAGFMLIRLVFLPSRHGYVMASFHWNHPAFIAGALLLVVGAAMLIPGVRFIRSSN